MTTDIITAAPESCAIDSRLRSVLDVIIPVFNEESTVLTVIEKVLACGIECNVIVVNDGSTDQTAERLETLQEHSNITIVNRPNRGGKGAAIRAAIEILETDVVLIQDADLEYDPSEIPKLIEPIQTGRADAVFGNRFSGDNEFLSLVQVLGNQLISRLFRIRTGSKLSDVETCYKAIRTDVFRKFSDSLCENGFAIEIEISSKLAIFPGIRIIELPISYVARDRKAGKKIRFIDGIIACWAILKYTLRSNRRSYSSHFQVDQPV